MSQYQVTPISSSALDNRATNQQGGERTASPTPTPVVSGPISALPNILSPRVCNHSRSLCERCFTLKRAFSLINHSPSDIVFPAFFRIILEMRSCDATVRMRESINYLKKQETSRQKLFWSAYANGRARHGYPGWPPEYREFMKGLRFQTLDKAEPLNHQKAYDVKHLFDEEDFLEAQSAQPRYVTREFISSSNDDESIIHHRGSCANPNDNWVSTVCRDCISIRKMAQNRSKFFFGLKCLDESPSPSRCNYARFLLHDADALRTKDIRYLMNLLDSHKNDYEADTITSIDALLEFLQLLKKDVGISDKLHINAIECPNCFRDSTFRNRHRCVWCPEHRDFAYLHPEQATRYQNNHHKPASLREQYLCCYPSGRRLTAKHGLVAEGLFNIKVEHRVDPGFISNIWSQISNSVTLTGLPSSWVNRLLGLIILITELVSESSMATRIRSALLYLLQFDLSSWFSNIQVVAQQLAQVFQAVIDRVKGHEERLEAQALGDDNIITLLAKIMLGIAGVKDIPFPDATKAVRTLELYSKSINSVEKIGHFIVRAFTAAHDLAMRALFGVDADLKELQIIQASIPEWMRRVHTFYNDGGVAACSKSREKAEMVADWKREGDEYLSLLVRCRVSPAAFQPFNRVYSMVSEMFKAGSVFHTSSALRPAPLVIYLHGKSGIGKSVVQNILITDLMTAARQREGRVFSPGEDIYTRNSTQDHWDNYNNQPVVVLDDFLQDRTPESVATQVMDLLRMNNVVSFPLKMASLETKGRTYFNSELVMITSNVPIPADITGVIRSYDAIRRRIDLMTEVHLTEDYATPNGMLDRDKIYKQYPPVQTEHGLAMQFPSAAYRFTVQNASGNVVLKNVPYERYLEYCNNKFQFERDSNGMLINMLRTRALQAQGKSTILTDDPDRFYDSEIDSQPSTSQQQPGFVGWFWGKTTPPASAYDELDQREREDSMDEEDRRAYEYLQNIGMPPPADWKDALKRKYERTSNQVQALLAQFATHATRWVEDLRKQITDSVYAKIGGIVLAVLVSGSIATYLFSGRKAKEQDEGIEPEGAVSGDERTAKYRPPRYVQEGAVSGDERTFKYRPPRYVSAEACSDVQAYDIGRHKVTNNCVTLTATVSDEHVDRVHTINGIFACGRILLLPHHFFHMMGEVDQDEIDLEVATHRGPVFRFRLNECRRQDFASPDKDLTMLELPKRFPNMADITKHFHEADSLNKLNLEEAVMWTVDPSNNTVIVTKCDAVRPVASVVYDVNTPDGIAEELRIARGFKYRAVTIKGYCGSPVMWLNSGVTTGKILGFHVAGGTNIGVSNVITRQFLFKHLAIWDPVRIETPDTEPLESQASVVGRLPHYGLVPPTKQARQCPVSEIEPSLLHGIFERKTAPALLRPNRNVNPFMKGIAKQEGDLVCMEPDILDEILLDMTQYLNVEKEKFSKIGILSYADAINGIPGVKELPPMEMHTSPGFPYVFERKAPGKYGFVVGTPGKYEMNHDLERRVLEREESAKKGIALPAIVIDCLKDERRPLAKVETGATRIFNVCPFDLNILVRKYFGAFIAHLMARHNEIEATVGINPHSEEWGMLYARLRRHPNLIGGDYTNYDKNLSYQCLTGILNIVQDFYQDEHSRIREVLFDNMFSSFHLVGREVYRVYQGNPSGIVMTTVVNSLVNMMYMRYAYVKCGGRVSDFTKNVSLAVYGDDNIGCVASICPWYNMLSIAAALKKIGVVFTPPSKGENLQKYLDWEDATFLKRSFREDGGRVYAPLAETSVNEMLNWVRKSPDPLEAIQQNFLACQREWFHYGKSEFYKRRNYAMLYARQHEVILPLLTYAEAGEYWGSEKPFHVITNHLKTLSRMDGSCGEDQVEEASAF